MDSATMTGNDDFSDDDFSDGAEFDSTKLRKRWIQMGQPIPIENDDFSDVVEFRRAAEKMRMEMRANPILPFSVRRSDFMKEMKQREKGKGKQIYLNPPPPSANIYSDEVGELDVSDAVLVHFDREAVTNQARYSGLFEFWYDCRRKAALQLFTHPGNDEYGGLSSYEGVVLEGHDQLHALANRAITIFNSLRTDMKLKLMKLHKANTRYRFAWQVYMTFDAIDEWCDEISTYQAAIDEVFGCEEVLGLFRDYRKDKTLAIMYLHGAEKDLAQREKIVREILEEAAIYQARGKGSEKFEYYD